MESLSPFPDSSFPTDQTGGNEELNNFPEWLILGAPISCYFKWDQTSLPTKEEIQNPSGCHPTFRTFLLTRMWIRGGGGEFAEPFDFPSLCSQLPHLTKVEQGGARQTRTSSLWWDWYNTRLHDTEEPPKTSWNHLISKQRWCSPHKPFPIICITWAKHFLPLSPIYPLQNSFCTLLRSGVFFCCIFSAQGKTRASGLFSYLKHD